METQTLKVGNATDVSSLAFAIHKFTEEGVHTELTCLGVLAVYTAIKAVIHANKLSISSGHAFYIFPQFRQAPALRPKTESERKTLVVFSLKKFSPGGSLWEDLRPRGRAVWANSSSRRSFEKHSPTTRRRFVGGSRDGAARKPQMSSFQDFTWRSKTKPAPMPWQH